MSTTSSVADALKDYSYRKNIHRDSIAIVKDNLSAKEAEIGRASCRERV